MVTWIFGKRLAVLNFIARKVFFQVIFFFPRFCYLELFRAIEFLKVSGKIQFVQKIIFGKRLAVLNFIARKFFFQVIFLNKLFFPADFK